MAGETVTVPGAGGPVKKQWVVVGGAVTVGVLGYAWWRHKTTAAAAVVDPAAAAAMLPPSSTTTPGISFTPPASPDASTLPPTTNSEWTQRAVNYLQGIGYDAQLVALVLGRYLARQPLSGVEPDIVRTAEGAIGKPPQGEYRIIIVGGTPGPGPTPSPTPTPTPASPAYQSVQAGWRVNQWIRDLQAGYGDQGGNHNATWALLVEWNPGLPGNVVWDHGRIGNSENNVFRTSATYRIR